MNAKDWIDELWKHPEWGHTEIDWEAIEEIRKTLKAFDKALDLLIKASRSEYTIRELDDFVCNKGCRYADGCSVGVEIHCPLIRSKKKHKEELKRRLMGEKK